MLKNKDLQMFHLFSLKLNKYKYVVVNHLKLWVAVPKHNFKPVKIKLGEKRVNK